jgi:acyl-CoA synthetase (NDP forming)
VGGVVLDVRDPDGLRAACRALADRLGPSRVLVQEQVAGGVELLVGGRRDPVFGPTLAFGLGGIFTEVWREVSLRLLPIGPDDAVELLREGRAAALLRGVRGRPACDEAGLASVLTGVGDLLADRPEVAELDLNPLIAAGARVVAVDALIMVAPGERRASDAT